MSLAAALPESGASARWRLAPWNDGPPEVVPAVEPSSPLYWERFRARLPVVVRGLTAGWAATRQWTFETVAARVGARPVPVVRVHDGLLGYAENSGMDYDHQPFDAFARRLARGGQPEWFLQLNPDAHLPELVDDLEVPIYSRRAHWRDRKITIAGAGTTTPIHRELPDNIFTVFYGAKEVVLFSPSDSRNLYGFGPFSGVPHLSAVDPRQYDADHYPRLQHSKPLRCHVRAGDALLIPRGWWHAVHTVEPSIALGSWWAVGAWSLLPRAATAYKRLFNIKT